MDAKILKLAMEIEQKSDQLLAGLQTKPRTVPEVPREDIRIIRVSPQYSVVGKMLELLLEWPQTRFEPGDIIRVCIIKGSRTRTIFLPWAVGGAVNAWKMLIRKPTEQPGAKVGPHRRGEEK